jgi:hypothetical protein
MIELSNGVELIVTTTSKVNEFPHFVLPHYPSYTVEAGKELLVAFKLEDYEKDKILIDNKFHCAFATVEVNENNRYSSAVYLFSPSENEKPIKLKVQYSVAQECDGCDLSQARLFSFTVNVVSSSNKLNTGEGIHNTTDAHDYEIERPVYFK